MTIDVFGRGALNIDHVIERGGVVQDDTHLPTQFGIDILDAAFAEGLLLMGAGLPAGLGVEQGKRRSRRGEQLRLVVPANTPHPMFLLQVLSQHRVGLYRLG